MFQKLVLLYMLSRVDFPLTNASLTEFVLEKGYAGFVSLQQALAELSEDGYVSLTQTRSQTQCQITAAGQEALSLLLNDLSAEVRAEIDSYLRTHGHALRELTAVSAEFGKKKPNVFVATMRVEERDERLIELTLTLPTEEAAEHVCDRWREKSGDIYAFILHTLLDDNVPDAI